MPLFLLNAISALETGWVVQLNGNASFGFCRAAVNMIGLSFCSMGDANHPACWSYIPHQTEGELMYTGTYREMERAAIALFSANLDKKCEFTTCIKHLVTQPRVQQYVAVFPSTKPKVTTRQEGAIFRSRPLRKSPTSAPIISQVNIVFLRHCM